MPIITIDGNIGSFKTSILNYFHKTFKIAIDLEPVESWHEFLNNMYTNQTDSTYNFQIKVWMDRCWIQEKSNVLVMMERNPYFIKNVFVEKAREDETINDEQYLILQSLHLKTDQLWKPNAYIYLRSDPEMCMKRITKRARHSEANIQLEYVRRIHELHEKMSGHVDKFVEILLRDKQLSSFKVNMPMNNLNKQNFIRYLSKFDSFLVALNLENDLANIRDEMCADIHQFFYLLKLK